MKIAGTIINGIKRLFFSYSKEDVKELVEIHNILLHRLASCQGEDKANMVKAVKEIDKILNRNIIT